MHTMLLADLATSARSSLDNIMSHVNRYILEKGPEYMVSVVTAAMIFFVGKWIARMVERGLSHGFKRAKIDETLSKFLCRIAYALLLCAVVLAALGRLGIETTSLAAVLAAAGLAVGMALQGSLSNFASGVMIILFRPFKVGDVIEAAGTLGVVDEIHIFHTLLHTPDNIDIVIPNSSITGGNISNLSSQPIRRIDMVFGCGYGDDLLAVKQLLEDIVSRDRRILLDPAPTVAVSELADNSVNFVVRPWVASGDYWNVKFALTEAVKLEFDAHGFSIPYPQQDIHVHQSGGAIHQDLGEPQSETSVSTPNGELTDQGLLRPRRAA